MRHFYRLTYIALLSAVPFMATAGDERAGTAGASELLINPWARSSGFGGMNTAMVRGVESMNGNVGGLSFTKKTEVVFTHTNWLSGSGVNINAFGLSQKVGASGALGVSVMSVDFGDIDITTYDRPEGGIGKYSPQFINFAVGYSKTFSNSIHGGVLVRSLTESVANSKAQGIVLDAGIQYTAGEDDKIKFGIGIRNVGLQMIVSGDGLAYDFTDPATGRNYKAFKKAQSFEVPSLLNIGGSYDFKLTEDHRLTVLGNFTSNSFSGNQIGLGAEYGFKKFLMLRGGYNAESENLDPSKSLNVHNGISCGGTFEVPLNDRGMTFGIDYSYRVTHLFNGTHAFGARITL